MLEVNSQTPELKTQAKSCRVNSTHPQNTIYNKLIRLIFFWGGRTELKELKSSPHQKFFYVNWNYLGPQADSVCVHQSSHLFTTVIGNNGVIYCRCKGTWHIKVDWTVLLWMCHPKCTHRSCSSDHITKLGGLFGNHFISQPQPIYLYIPPQGERNLHLVWLC